MKRMEIPLEAKSFDSFEAEGQDALLFYVHDFNKTYGADPHVITFYMSSYLTWDRNMDSWGCASVTMYPATINTAPNDNSFYYTGSIQHLDAMSVISVAIDSDDLATFSLRLYKRDGTAGKYVNKFNAHLSQLESNGIPFSRLVKFSVMPLSRSFDLVDNEI